MVSRRGCVGPIGLSALTVCDLRLAPEAGNAHAAKTWKGLKPWEISTLSFLCLQKVNMSGITELMYVVGSLVNLDDLEIKDISWAEAKGESLAADIRLIGTTRPPIKLRKLNVVCVGANVLEDIGLWLGTWGTTLRDFKRIRIRTSTGTDGAAEMALKHLRRNVMELHVLITGLRGELVY